MKNGEKKQQDIDLYRNQLKFHFIHVIVATDVFVVLKVSNKNTRYLIYITMSVHATEGHVPIKIRTYSWFIFKILKMPSMNYIYLQAIKFVSDRNAPSVLSCCKYNLNKLIFYRF